MLGQTVDRKRADGAAILLVPIASNLRVGVTRADIAFSLAMSLGFNLLLGVHDLLGPGVLFRFLEKARLTTIP